MAIDAASPRSRRALLAAGLGAGAATVASALGRPLPAKATDLQPLILGYPGLGNSTWNRTELFNNVDAALKTPPPFVFLVSSLSGQPIGLRADSKTNSGVFGVSVSADGVRGLSTSGAGISGASTSGKGVVATSTSNFAVHGTSQTNVGVFGGSFGTAAPATVGHSAGGNTGVFGFSGGGSIPATPAKVGVHGRCDAGGGIGVSGASASGNGVRGTSTSSVGVRGISDASVGVYGSSISGFGVYGHSANDSGVRGLSDTAIGVSGGGVLAGVDGVGSVGPGVSGTALTSSGVYGYSGAVASRPDAVAKTGVYGLAVQDATAAGVHGTSTVGRGVVGQATSGVGLQGVATTGYALKTTGRLKLEKASGVATIAKTKSAVTVAPGLDVTLFSFVLLTARADVGTRRLWYTTDATANTITIRVSSAVTANLAVGWLLLG